MNTLISKKLFLYCTVISLSIAPGVLLGTSGTSALKELTNTHNLTLESSLMSIMHEVETSLAYWHSMEDTPFSYAVIRGPKGWISSKTAKDEIQNHIATLSYKQEQIATALGSLAQFQTIKDTLTDTPTIQATADLCFGIVDVLMGKTTGQSQFTGKALSDYGIQAIERLPQFHDEYLTHIASHIKPNHFIRNWTKYAIGTGCVIVAAALTYANQDKLGTWKNSGKDAILNFWNNHITIPLLNSRDILFGRKHIDVITPEAVAGSKNSFIKSLDELLPVIKPGASQEELAALRSHILDTKDSSLLVEFWGKQAKHLIWNATTNFYNGNLHFLEANASLIQLKDWQLNQATLAAQQQWEAQQLNAELLAIFPVMLGLYGVKKGYDILFHGKILSEPLQHRLILIDKLLNTYNTGDIQLDLKGVGYMNYHAHALLQYVSRIPSSQQKPFKADIAELTNPAFTVGQKSRVIDQMYRQYDFLNPLAV